MAKPLSLLRPSYNSSWCWKYSIVKLLKESGINPEAFAGQKNNSKGKRKIVNDRETLSFWHNKQPDPRACRQEQWAMIFRFWNIYFCVILFQIMHCSSELISYVWRLTLFHSSSLEISANVLVDSYSMRSSPCFLLSAIQLFPWLILSARELQQEQRIACASIRLKGQMSYKGYSWSICGGVAAQTGKGQWRRFKGSQSAVQEWFGVFFCFFKRTKIRENTFFFFKGKPWSILLKLKIAWMCCLSNSC